MHVHNARLRHGHAPGHVRDTFTKAVEEFLNWKPGEAEPTVEHEVNYEPCSIPISRGCTLVWSCTDIVSGDLVDRLGSDLELKSRTYAACARAIHAEIRSRLAA
ncbi:MULTISPECIES: hypothetical protein [unclassified Bradyrhizobium]|uniref:hypothetical protein n=1 Tax=unclassified Bradyrhizobium TaxID=2631580 RepID=UPI001FFA19DA|nr:MULTISPECIES: hypothetical protein [unclassified Bradyrhizobium]MCK1324208.1 hypothetical protein [Bradyrhizobium sp. 156]MCK1498932.1 hypothetical protein [Bradyrhizobium sp. 188]MCK1565191.1 hypothetical protein [Bradyrhizobium sp. 173]UPJ83565.1 hypothetical protein IVB17_17265 [Bradyrhizobium sp. 184]UPJ91356.1 hypothetical protein IVB16_17265 [Bradyrhizobium sp. 183]